MSVRNQFKLLLGGLGARRAGRVASPQSATKEFLDRSRLVAAAIFVITVVAIVLISSAGVTTLNVPILPDQVAAVHVTASAAFTYESAEKSRTARDQFLDRVPPVYRLDPEPFRRFEAAARTLLAQLAAYETAHPAGSPASALTPPAVSLPALSL